MWWNICKFELVYRSKRPATYIYFFIIFLLCFGAVTSDFVSIGGGTGLVKENAPIVLTRMMIIISAVLTVITSAVMGVAVLRDFEYKTESLIFVNPISKGDYLLGRFSGSFLVALFIFSAMPLSFMIGDLMPWREADRLLPWAETSYWLPFFVFVVPNLLFSGAVFFAGGALSRKMIVVYTQGILLLVLYQVALVFTRDVEDIYLSAILDPFAVSTVNYISQYWTVSEKNSLLIEMSGVVLYNRLLWVGAALLVMAVTYFSFSFNVVRGKAGNKNKETAGRKPRQTIALNQLPRVAQTLNGNTYALQLRRMTGFYFNMLFKEIPFLAIIISGMAIFLLNTFNMGKVFGTETYPTTYLMLEQMQGFILFFIIIVVFYSGELIWKERNVKINLIYDATPVPDWIALVSKFLALCLSYAVILLVLITFGVGVQAVKGYYNFEIGLYLSRSFSQIFPFLVLFTMFSFFVQVMVNNKYIGFTILIAFFFISTILEVLGVEHGLIQFASGSLGTYSDMNGYGPYPPSYTWFRIYWFAFSMVLLIVSFLFSVRGTETVLKNRWKISKLRFTRGAGIAVVLFVLTFISSGFYIFYNTNVLNTYRTSDEEEELQAEYEKQLKQYQGHLMPKITHLQAAIDIFPDTRDYRAKGTYTLVNKTGNPVSDMHIQLPQDTQVNVDTLTFNRKATVKEAFESFRFFIYKLHKPLQPNDTLKLYFRQTFTSKGFKESGENTSIVQNGTFFNNSLFPQLGYNQGAELTDENERKKKDLPPRNRAYQRDDPKGYNYSFIGQYADVVSLDVTLSTVSDQIAIAPGYLQKEWEEDGRRYFHYQTSKPVLGFFSFVSADYEVLEKKWQPAYDSTRKPVNLAIYHHNGHEYNLTRMMQGMQDALNYYSANFAPYQFNQMRIMEFPRYSSFAQSFANTVPFSESIGFILDIDDEKDVDIAYYVTAHEMAHQWWAHQLVPANTQGAAMLSESLSQYSALMVMKKRYSETEVQQFLKQELNRYLQGRSNETKKELPLNQVENQQYIHYGKGGVNFYALQDYIGEDSVNAALRRCLNDWNIYTGVPEQGRFPTTADLMPYLEEVTPDSLQYLIDDFFRSMILFENKTTSATYVENNDRYKVTLDLETRKLKADSLGVETEVPLDYWIDVGVYGENKKGEDSLVYLQKHRFTNDTTTITVEVTQLPVKAGIDPVHKLIDRNPSDNTKTIAKQKQSQTSLLHQ